ncbi:hypothetical protein EPUS_09159 [Endocarpon pusillum Z07020]|uniref:Heterokaryon incompatibility domain-containing protein n=1 Tax=Endocarpon pusillum (strain Z07020 / HMAS-L-300199) TaxID=1263415 RepID=U1GRL0_ENDPU|nr:uncharacterized protein EPUS_09159 [Endocarpon pusillum Z07020]ERF75018.1 hypothetical protein EPUS_09159 [Endocarpon pusillum Z07020]
MNLCALCRSIPFERLPQLPSDWECIINRRELPSFVFNSSLSSALDVPIGFRYHSSLEDLAASAGGCRLCDLLNDSVSGFSASYRKAENDPLFAYYEDAHLGLPSNFQFWLTKRINGGDGFLVLVRARREGIIYLVGAVGFCVKEDSALASLYKGRPVEEDGGSPTTLDRAAAWVQNCVRNHEDCQAGGSIPLPSRLLDLESCTNQKEIRLRGTGGIHGRYAALSHSARKEAIKIEELPKTFQDADDLEDWARESANMAAVYSNAHLTIAAAHATDSSAGCFNRRKGRRHIPVDYITQDGTSGQLLAFLVSTDKEAASRLYIEMSHEPLTKRAWALQERLLGQRILHDGTDQMYYECNHEFVSEDGFRDAGRYCNLFGATDSGRVGRRSQHSDEHAFWYHLLWYYGSRRLSNPSDKLPAMSGLARIFESRVQASYVAGLWSNALIEGLAWQGVRSTKDPTTSTSQAYIAPAWSWASYDGIAATGQGKEWKDIAKVLDYHIKLKTSNPYGELEEGWIMIRAPLVRVSLSDEPEKTRTSNDDAARELVKRLELFALVLQRWDKEKNVLEKSEQWGKGKSEEERQENREEKDDVEKGAQEEGGEDQEAWNQGSGGDDCYDYFTWHSFVSVRAAIAGKWTNRLCGPQRDSKGSKWEQITGALPSTTNASYH